MVSLSSATSSSFHNEVNRRALPSFYVLDERLHVVSSCGDAPLEMGEMPCDVRDMVLRARTSGRADAFALVLGERCLRVVAAKQRPYLCVILERLRSDPVVEARRRYKLTPRESDVLGLLLRGCTTEEIARTLDIALTTTADYTKRIISKTGSQNRSQVIVRVLAG